jgi:hypothetical protein
MAQGDPLARDSAGRRSVCTLDDAEYSTRPATPVRVDLGVQSFSSHSASSISTMFSVQTSALPTRHAHLDNMGLIAGESGRWVAMRSVKPLDRR